MTSSMPGIWLLRIRLLFLCSLAIPVLVGCDSNTAGSITRALQYKDDRQYSAAIVELKSFLQHDLDNAEARLLLGNIYLEAESGAYAEKELRKARSLGIADNIVIPPLARALLLQNSYDAVLKLEFADTPSAASMAELEASRALAYLELKQQDKATTHINSALQTAPGSAWVRYVHARILMEEDSHTEAKAVLVKLLNAAPRDGPAWSLLGIVNNKLGRIAEAEHAFTQAIANRTAVSLDHYRRGTARMQQGKLDAAAEDAASLLTRNPTWVAAGYFAGRIKFRQKRYAEAEQILNSTYQLDFTNFDVIFLLARSYLALGNLERAEALAKTAFELKPDSGFTRKILADIYLRQGKDRQAKELLYSANMTPSKKVPARTATTNALMQPAAANRPDDNEQRVVMARKNLSVNEARRVIALLAKIPRKDDELLFLQADAYFRLQQYDHARRALELVRKRTPDSLAAHYGLAKIYKALGDTASAQGSLLKARELLRSRKK